MGACTLSCCVKPSWPLLISSLFAFSQSHPSSFHFFPHFSHLGPPLTDHPPNGTASIPHQSPRPSRFSLVLAQSFTAWIKTPHQDFFPQGLISGPHHSLATIDRVHKPTRTAHQTQHNQNCYKCLVRPSFFEFLPETSILQQFQSW